MTTDGKPFNITDPNIKPHWCSTNTDYKLSDDHKFWVNTKHPTTKFCNMPDDEHEKYRKMEVSFNNISTWCTRCSDCTV